MTEMLREVIINQLWKTRGEITDIINKVIWHQMKYNLETDKFEIQLRDLSTTYFTDHPDEREGKLEGSDIRWEVNSEKLLVWLDL